MMKKTEMAAFIKSNSKKVSKNLRDMATYTIKMYEDSPKSVTVQDLRTLVKEMQAELAVATPQATSASVKKEATSKKEASEKKVEKSEKKAKKEKTSEEVTTEEKPKKKVSSKKKAEESAEEEEKPKKKTGGKKSKKFASGVEPKNTVGEAFDLAEVLCAVYWTERHLEQFAYANIEGIEQPKKFENDLDLVSIIFVAPDNSYMLGVSSYTFVPYTFSGKSLKQSKGIRYTNGAEYNIYTIDAEVDAE